MEYPKRVYKNGKGHTVHSLEEEREFLGTTASVVEMPAVPEVVEEEELSDEEKAQQHTDQEKEALEYLTSLGYSKKEARKVLKNEGLEKVLKSKEEGTDPQE